MSFCTTNLPNHSIDLQGKCGVNDIQLRFWGNLSGGVVCPPQCLPDVGIE